MVQVPMSSVRITFLDNAVDPSHMLVAINGTMVGLCVSGVGEGAPGHSAGMEECAGHGRGGVEECVGLGLVRAVDVQRQLLFLITPVHLEVNFPIHPTTPPHAHNPSTTLSTSSCSSLLPSIWR